MINMNSASPGVARRIIHAEDHILCELGKKLKWDGGNIESTKLTIDEKIEAARRAYRCLKRRKKNEPEQS